MKTPLLLCSLAILAQVPIKGVTGTTSTVPPTMVTDTTLSTTASNTDATTTTKVAVSPTTDTQTSAATNNITTSTATATTVTASDSTSVVSTEAKPVSTTTKSSTGTSIAEATILTTDSTSSSSDLNITVTSAVTTNNNNRTAAVENTSSAAVTTGNLPTSDIQSTISDIVETTQTSRISTTDSRNVVMTSVTSSTTAAVITPGDTSTSDIVGNPQTSGKTTDNIQTTDLTVKATSNIQTTNSTGKATDNMQTTDSARSSSDSDTTKINVVTTTTAATKDNTSTTGAIGKMSTVDVDSNSTTSDVIGVSQTTPKKAEPSTTTIQATTQTPLRTTHVATRPTTTPPPVTRIPPTENRIISLEFEIVYQDQASHHKATFDSMPAAMQADVPKQNLQKNLTDLYENNTSGFHSLTVTSMPNGTYDKATYGVEYRSAILTSDCTSESGCLLVREIKEKVVDLIPEYGQLPNRPVDEEATRNAMNETLQKESERLENPCLMNKHVCANPGHTETCIFSNSTNYWCVDVCRPRSTFCRRGTCTAYDTDNIGYNGIRNCSCPPHLHLSPHRDDCLDVPTTCGPFEYLDKDGKCRRRCERFHFLSSNDQCVSWWAVLGPLIGVTVIAFLSVLAVVVLIRRKPPKEKRGGLGESYTDDPRYTSVPTRVSAQGPPYQFDNNAHEPLESFAAPGDTTSTAKQEEKEPVTYEDVNEKLLPKETPTSLKEQDLQDFVSLTNADDLAQHPKLRDFSPQLDRVDTSKQYKIPRIGGSTRPYEENQSSAIPRTSMYQYSNPTYQNEEAVIRL